MTRSNGLGAPAYSSIAQFRPGLDDPSAQALLAQLESAGIAAYLQSAAEGDDLYVDLRQIGQARDLLPQTAPAGAEPAHRPHVEPTDREPHGERHDDGHHVDEDVWAELMASFNSPDATPVGRWPASEDVSLPTEPQTDSPAPGSSPDDTDEPAAAEPSAGGVVGSSGTSVYQVTGWEPYVHARPARTPDDVTAELDASDEHFVPPEPPPFPPVTFYVGSGWFCAIAVPVLLVVLGMFEIVIPSWALLLAGGAFVYGLAVLFGQMRTTPLDADGEPIDDDDDGATL